MTNQKWLRSVLKMNALSCFLFGVIFVVGSGQVSLFLSAEETYGFWVQILGGGLLVNSGLLLLASQKVEMSLFEIRFFAIGDFLWVAGTLVLIAQNLALTEPPGVAAAMLVAIMVFYFGIQQWDHSKAALKGD